MNITFISDGLWYSGHILTCISILFTHDQYYLAVSLTIVGQFITIISRPISRIKLTDSIETTIANNDEESNEEIV
jgi:hypothetical protein